MEDYLIVTTPDGEEIKICAADFCDDPNPVYPKQVSKVIGRLSQYFYFVRKQP